MLVKSINEISLLYKLIPKAHRSGDCSEQTQAIVSSETPAAETS